MRKFTFVRSATTLKNKKNPGHDIKERKLHLIFKGQKKEQPSGFVISIQLIPHLP